MAGTSHAGAATANLAPHNCADRSRTNVRSESLTAALMRVAHRVFGPGLPKKLARRTDRSTRTVEYWLADNRALDLDSFQRLCAVDVKFLDAFMDTIPATIREQWLQEQILAAKLAKAEKRAAEQHEEIEQLRLELKGRK